MPFSVVNRPSKYGFVFNYAWVTRTAVVFVDDATIFFENDIHEPLSLFQINELNHSEVYVKVLQSTDGRILQLRSIINCSVGCSEEQIIKKFDELLIAEATYKTFLK